MHFSKIHKPCKIRFKYGYWCIRTNHHVHLLHCLSSVCWKLSSTLNSEKHVTFFYIPPKMQFKVWVFNYRGLPVSLNQCGYSTLTSFIRRVFLPTELLLAGSFLFLSPLYSNLTFGLNIKALDLYLHGFIHCTPATWLADWCTGVHYNVEGECI